MDLASAMVRAVDIGGPKDVYTLANYRKFVANPVDSAILGIPVTLPIHMITFFNTVIFSALVTFITFLLTYPLAYYLAANVVKPSVQGFEDNPKDIHRTRWLTKTE